MSKMNEYEKKIAGEIDQVRRERKVIEIFGQDETPVIVSLNDSQGVNISLRLNRLAYPGLIAQAFEDEGVKVISHNMSSLLYNKTYHTRMFLDNNISMSENAELQVRGAVAALRKAMSDFGFPRFIGNIGNLTRIFYRPKKSNKDIRVADSIENANRPLVLYSSGANDLMRIIGSNPASLKKDLNPKNGDKVGYQYLLRAVENGVVDAKSITRCISRIRGKIAEWERDLEKMSECGSLLQHYDESSFILRFEKRLVRKIDERKDDIASIKKAISIIEKAYNPNTIKTVVKGMKSNIEDIYRLNPNAVICVLGIYVPNVAEGSLLDKVASKFNRATKAMCGRMKATYIDVSEIGSKYCFKGKNFHISPEGHEAVANEIINKLYSRFSRTITVPIIKPRTDGLREPDGIRGLRRDLDDYKCKFISGTRFGRSTYSSQRSGEISSEIDTELHVAEEAYRDSREQSGFQRRKRRRIILR